MKDVDFRPKFFLAYCGNLHKRGQKKKKITINHFIVELRSPVRGVGGGGGVLLRIRCSKHRFALLEKTIMDFYYTLKKRLCLFMPLNFG